MMDRFRNNIGVLLTLGLPGINSLSAELNAWLERNTDEIPLSLLNKISLISGYSSDRLLKSDLNTLPSFKNDIKLVIFDVDGVMTDAGMYYSESGDELKKFNARDGLAIRKLSKSGMLTGVISHGINEKLIKKRCDLLGISHVYAGTAPKQDILKTWCNELSIDFSQVAFIGDDVNDLPIMRVVGFTACPADASWPVREYVDMVLVNNGGAGAVREWLERCFIDMTEV